MARQKEPNALNEELKNSNNLISTTQGYVELPENFDEDRYYYYRNGGTTEIFPVQLVGGMIKKLTNVDGIYKEVPSADLPTVTKLFTLKDVPIGEKLQELIGPGYTKETPKKFLDAAHRYAELREKLMDKMITVEEASILFQGDQELLPSTKSRYSLGYNEDAYIKSSIAYEIEMYLRSIFSSYGLLDNDIKDIFQLHNLREAFLKLPRTVRTKVYQAYHDELRRKAIEENAILFENIIKNENIEEMINIKKDGKNSDSKTYLRNILRVYDFIKKDVVISSDTERLIQRVEQSLQTTENDSEQQLNQIPENYEGKYSTISKAYVNYKKLGVEYEIYVKIINNISKEIRRHLKLLSKLNNLESSKRHEYATTIDENFKNEYKKVLKAIENIINYITALKSKIGFYTKTITRLEEEMSKFVFAEELGMVIAYPVNRYTYEADVNNNYDNMLILLNCLKKVTADEQYTLPDYHKKLEAIDQDSEGKQHTIIKLSKEDKELFVGEFSRKDARFTCNGRKTKEGKISRFFRSKSEPMLDALYSAELRYLGALQIKDVDDNLYMAELGIASELYLKSLLRTPQTIHNKLHDIYNGPDVDLKSEIGSIANDLYLKSHQTTHKLYNLYKELDNDLKAEIIRKVNSILGQNSDADFQTTLNKETINNAFTNYRYLYENEPQEIDINFLSAFTQALHLIAKERLNYKSPYYDEIEKTIHPEEDAKEKNNL